MKKKLSILIALVMAISLCVAPAVALATDAPTIDGVINAGEWNGATVIPVAGTMGTVSVIASTDYLYVLFDVVDVNDARTQYVNEVGNDQISININPTAGVATWGFPYDLIFETSALSDGVCGNCPDDGGHHCLPWNPKVNSGTLDGWATRWFPDDAQIALPDDLESATTYTGINRVTEWRLPLVLEAGATLEVGGAIDVGDGNSYMYPVGLDWTDPTTFEDISIPPLPVEPTPKPEEPVLVRSPDAFDVFVRWGYDSTRYYSNDALAGSIEAAGEYNDTRYMLEIPKGCVVTGATERINWLWLDSIDDGVLTFHGGDATFSEPCTLYITDGGRLYQDYWTGDWLGGGEWVEVGSFTAIKDGEAHLD